MHRSALNEKEENIMFQVKDVRLDYGRLRDEPRAYVQLERAVRLSEYTAGHVSDHCQEGRNLPLGQWLG